MIKTKANTLEKRVLILGAAPNATVPKAEVVYCANAASFYFSEKISGIPKVVSVVGEHLIAGVNESQAPLSLKKTRNAIFQSKIHEMLILEHSPWFDGWNTDKGLQDAEDACGSKPKTLLFSERAKLLKNTSGLTEPIFSYTLFAEAMRMNPWRFLRSSKTIIRDLCKKKASNKVEMSPVLRPSTGIWAAIIAMDRHGPDAEYLISGIGLSARANRLNHTDGSSQGRYEKFTHHLHADIRIFRELERRYNVKVLQ
jgi:hypothetical protein